MQENHLFEYAVIRVVPKVEREEFLNVGVILYCSDEKFLNCMIEFDEARLSAFSPTIDIQELKEHITSFKKICAGGKAAGDIGQLSMAERFRWLTSTRSTMLQSSKVHPGLCTNAAGMLASLHKQLVQTDDDTRGASKAC
jgi:hypothetical protein